MKTLKQTWLDLMREILDYNVIVEDYYEKLGINVQFGFDNIDELLLNEHIKADTQEMKKVFFSDEANKFNHSYSKTILTPYPSINSPIEAICKLLKNNKSSRKAVLTFAPYGEEKVPCITSIQFVVRDNVLNVFYTSRSQDIYRKFPCDAICIASYAKQIAQKLNFGLGSISANIISPHVYVANKEEALQYLDRE